VLSEAETASLRLHAFEVIAHLAPTLGEAEFRVLTALAKRFAGTANNSGQISSRALAVASRVSHSNTCRALQNLNRKKLIASRPGTATQPAGHVLTFLRIEQIGVPATGTPPVENDGEVYLSQVQGVPFSGTPLHLFQEEGVPFSGTPVPFSGTPSLSKERACAGASIDRLNTDSIIDRLRQCDPKKCDPVEIHELRKWVHGYYTRFPARDNPNPHPPDDALLAQLLSVAPMHRVVHVIDQLRDERKEAGYSYGWLVSTVAQREYGINPETLKIRRAQLRVAKKRIPALRGEQQPLIEETPAPRPEPEKPDPGFGTDLLADVQLRRKAKGA
jgi:hypothetical protein